VVPKTHQLDDLLVLLLPGNAALGRLQRKAGALTQFAVDYRYPGLMASKRQMEAALRYVDQIRLECRSKLNLSPP
jgi:hypothetical protein